MAAAFEKEHRISQSWQDYCNKLNKLKIRITYNVSTGYIKTHHYYNIVFNNKENLLNALETLQNLSVENDLAKES